MFLLLKIQKMIRLGREQVRSSKELIVSGPSTINNAKLPRIRGTINTTVQMMVFFRENRGLNRNKKISKLKQEAHMVEISRSMVFIGRPPH